MCRTERGTYNPQIPPYKKPQEGPVPEWPYKGCLPASPYVFARWDSYINLVFLLSKQPGQPKMPPGFDYITDNYAKKPIIDSSKRYRQREEPAGQAPECLQPLQNPRL